MAAPVDYHLIMDELQRTLVSFCSALDDAQRDLALNTLAGNRRVMSVLKAKEEVLQRESQNDLGAEDEDLPDVVNTSDEIQIAYRNYRRAADALERQEEEVNRNVLYREMREIERLYDEHNRDSLRIPLRLYRNRHRNRAERRQLLRDRRSSGPEPNTAIMDTVRTVMSSELGIQNKVHMIVATLKYEVPERRSEALSIVRQDREVQEALERYAAEHPEENIL